MKNRPRIAFFTDCYHEVNGVAHTSRQFEAFARRRELPFLCVRAGESTFHRQDATISTLELRRGPVRLRLDRDLTFDLLLWRHTEVVECVVKDFEPDLIHITGPGDIGQLGAYIAHRLRIPLVASWHTNLHEFGAHRLGTLLSFLPPNWRADLTRVVESQILRGVLRFYRIARVLMAPNEDLTDMLELSTGRPTYLMRRGVDTELFSPYRRDLDDGVFRLGFVGRLTPEKNVRLLARVERELLDAGLTNFRFLIVGEGSERVWLERNLQHCEFTGVLKGIELARAYANMDLFLFPSRADAFGNVVLEAMASGVPAVVTNEGGPKFLLQHGVSGYVAIDDGDFAAAAVEMMSHPERCSAMREEARRQASAAASWDSVWERVYDAYSRAAQSSHEIGVALPVNGAAQ